MCRVIIIVLCVFFFNDTATTEIYTLSLHDALPIYPADFAYQWIDITGLPGGTYTFRTTIDPYDQFREVSETNNRSEEHTSELQSRQYLVCRLLLEKKKNTDEHTTSPPYYDSYHC